MFLSVALLLQMCAGAILGVGGITAEAADSNEQVSYEDDFEYETFNVDDLISPVPYWEVENYYYKGTKPEIVDGVIKMTTGNSIQFDWMQVSGIGSFDATKTYTFEFDAKVTDPGVTDGGTTRALFVAMGGWYNQVEINTGTDKCRAGESSWSTYEDATFTNQVVHIKLEWCGKTITSTITNQQGNVLLTGSREKNNYNFATQEDSLMTYLVLRCEEGSVEIENFQFNDGTTSYDHTSDVIIQNNVWELERKRGTGTKPEIADGILKMSTGNYIQFDWTQVPNISTYDSTKTYTFEFDVEVTDEGSTQTGAWSRALFVASGGWRNQVEIDPGSQIKLSGNSSTTWDSTKFTNQKLHVKLEWLGDTITSTITNQQGDFSLTGSRSTSDYQYPAYDAAYLVLRCEDGAVEIDNFKFSDGTVSYEQTFGQSQIDQMLSQDVWDLLSATKPEIVDGILTMTSGNSLQFNWMQVPGIGAFDETQTYTFEFDAKVKHDGYNNDGPHTRLLYVAPGGHYNQIEINNASGQLRTGDTYATYDSAKFMDQTVHIEIEWFADTITSTITDQEGNTILTGYRTDPAFNYTNSGDTYMKNFVFRCDDGEIEIDNFQFTKRYVERGKNETAISIPSGDQAIYESQVTYAEGSMVKLEMGGTDSSGNPVTGELFKISDSGMFIHGYACAGTFNDGVYGTKIFLNPTQESVLVEVTLPDGGVIRRGSYSLLYGCTSVTQMVASWSDITDPVTDEQVTYEEINQNTYTVNTSEPVYEGFEANVYNLVTSFDVDAKTTRTFAWTVLESFVGDDAMAVQYKVEDTDEWYTVAGEKEAEKTEYDVEDYFKADIDGLTAGTTYEYRIVKINSSDEIVDNGKTYTFTTEAETVDEFSFITIGDTQATGWTGRGYMYAQAALNQAVLEEQSLAFLLHTGDVVESGDSIEQWNWYFKSLGDIGKIVPHFAAIGNHDTWGTSDNFDLHFNHPDNGGSAAFAEGTSEGIQSILGNDNATLNSFMENLDETTYSFNYGKAHFIVLNTGTYYQPTDEVIQEGQREWLKQDLEANKDAEWTIIMGHQPVYHRKGGWESSPWLHDIIEEYGVDLVLHGHSHLVTRTYPMKNGEIVSKSITDTIPKGTGTVYATVGSTTTNHDKLSAGILEEMFTVFTPADEQPTYTAVKVDNNALKVTIKQVNGLVVDEFTIVSSDEKEDVFTGATLELGGKIGFNFYVDKNHTLSGDAFVEFDLPRSGKQTVSINEAVETSHGLKFTCQVPAKEMADEVTGTLYDGEQKLDAQSVSIRDYAETIIENKFNLQSYTEATPLMKAMLHYGAYSQKLFAYNTENLANEICAAEDNISDVTVNSLVSYAKGYQGVSGFGRLAGASLILEGETTFRLFFEFEDGVNVDGLKFVVNGIEKSFTQSGQYYIVECENIGAKDLDLDNQVVVMIGEETKFEASCSVMTFCYNALNNASTKAALQDVARALYLYNDAANQYMQGEVVALSDDYELVCGTVEANALKLHKTATFINGTFSAELNTNGRNDAGIVFGADENGQNYYLYRLAASSDVIQLVKVENGIETILDRGYLTAGRDHYGFNRLEVVKQGNDIYCYYYNQFDKIVCYAAYEDKNPLSGTSVGLWTKTSEPVFQNVQCSYSREIRKAEVLIFGHSYTEMWGNYQNDFSEYKSIDDIGIGGSVALHWEQLTDEVIAYEPKLGIYNIGINDLTRETTPRAVIASIERAMLTVKEALPEFKVVLVSVNHCPARSNITAQISETNALMRNLAASYDWMYYAEAEYLFCTDPSDPLTANSELFTDGLHPTAEGYKLLAASIKSAINGENQPIYDETLAQECFETAKSNKLASLGIYSSNAYAAENWAAAESYYNAAVSKIEACTTEAELDALDLGEEIAALDAIPNKSVKVVANLLDTDNRTELYPVDPEGDDRWNKVNDNTIKVKGNTYVLDNTTIYDDMEVVFNVSNNTANIANGGLLLRTTANDSNKGVTGYWINYVSDINVMQVWYLNNWYSTDGSAGTMNYLGGIVYAPLGDILGIDFYVKIEGSKLYLSTLEQYQTGEGPLAVIDLTLNGTLNVIEEGYLGMVAWHGDDVSFDVKLKHIKAQPDKSVNVVANLFDVNSRTELYAEDKWTKVNDNTINVEGNTYILDNTTIYGDMEVVFNMSNNAGSVTAGGLLLRTTANENRGIKGYWINYISTDNQIQVWYLDNKFNTNGTTEIQEYIGGIDYSSLGSVVGTDFYAKIEGSTLYLSTYAKHQAGEEPLAVIDLTRNGDLTVISEGYFGMLAWHGREISFDMQLKHFKAQPDKAVSVIANLFDVNSRTELYAEDKWTKINNNTINVKGNTYILDSTTKYDDMEVVFNMSKNVGDITAGGLLLRTTANENRGIKGYWINYISTDNQIQVWYLDNKFNTNGTTEIQEYIGGIDYSSLGSVVGTDFYAKIEGSTLYLSTYAKHQAGEEPLAVIDLTRNGDLTVISEGYFGMLAWHGAEISFDMKLKHIEAQ